MLQNDQRLETPTHNCIPFYRRHTVKADSVPNSLKFKRQEKQKVQGKNLVPKYKYGMWGKEKVSKWLMVTEEDHGRARNYTRSHIVL